MGNVTINENGIKFKFDRVKLTNKILKEKVESAKVLLSDSIEEGFELKFLLEGRKFTIFDNGNEELVFLNSSDEVFIKKVNQKWIEIESLKLDGEYFDKIALCDYDICDNAHDRFWHCDYYTLKFLIVRSNNSL